MPDGNTRHGDVAALLLPALTDGAPVARRGPVDTNRTAPTDQTGTPASSAVEGDDVASSGEQERTGADAGGEPAVRYPGLVGDGAAKLADAAVAPAVAAARGYRSVTPETCSDWLCKLGLRKASSGAKRLGSLVGSSSALLMPWHAVDGIVAARDRDGDIPVASWQAKPSVENRRVDDAGREIKYELLVGRGGSDATKTRNVTVIGANPVLPTSWLREPAKVFVTEGMIKADSALSAYAAHLGAGEDLLDSADPDGLRAFLDSRPAEERILVLAVVGVGNWKNNPEWRMVDLRGGKELWVAFDGDLSSNQNVWKQAHDLFDLVASKQGRPMLLDLTAVQTPDGTKVGVDDYLARCGDWDSLVRLLTPDLPPSPLERTGARREGEWVMDNEACVTRAWVRDKETNDLSPVVKAELVGRVRSLTDRRMVSDSELRTGQLDENPPHREQLTVVEISWVEEGRGKMTVSCEGVSDFLSHPPVEWDRPIYQMTVPQLLTFHPDWPPRSSRDGKNEWLEALKRNRRGDVAAAHAWENMGWVPTDGGNPVFIVGDQVYGVDGLQEGDAREAIPAVVSRGLAVARNYDLRWPFDDDDAREAISATIKAYVGSWANRGHAAAAIAAGLRSLLPTPSHTPLLLTGPPRTGKSWTAAAAMHFLAAGPGTWSNNRLPGSADDTSAATEDARSRTLLWVSDDLPPSPDQRTAATQEAAMGRALRSAHNGRGRARMNEGMRRRPDLEPRAQFVVTAENSLSVHSVNDRVVHLEIRKGALIDIEEVGRLSKLESRPIATVTGAALSAIMDRLAEGGWQAVRALEADLHESMLKVMKQALQRGLDKQSEAGRRREDTRGDFSRHAEMGADLGAGLVLLRQVCTDLGMGAEAELVKYLIGDLAMLIVESYFRQAEDRPARALLRAIATALSSRQAHLASPDSGDRPIVNDSDQAAASAAFPGMSAAQINQSIGWTLAPKGSKSSDRPEGPRIGYVVRPARGSNTEELVAILDPEAAFKAAASAASHLVPYGTKPREAWAAVRSEDGVLSTAWTPRYSGGVVRAYGVTGIPVRLTALLGVDDDDEDGDVDAASSQ